MKANVNPVTDETPISIATGRQEKAIIALLNEPTTKDAALLAASVAAEHSKTEFKN